MAKNKPRDWNAVAAHFRNSAGAMKDRRSERGGTCNSSRDFLDDYYLEDAVVDTGAAVVGNNNCSDNTVDGLGDL